MLQKLYTAKEVAESLHVTVRTLYTYVYDGRLKGVKTSGRLGRGGGRWSFTEAQINDFLAQNSSENQPRLLEGEGKVPTGEK